MTEEIDSIAQVWVKCDFNPSVNVKEVILRCLGGSDKMIVEEPAFATRVTVIGGEAIRESLGGRKAEEISHILVDGTWTEWERHDGSIEFWYHMPRLWPGLEVLDFSRSGVKSIGQGSFVRCQSLKTVTFGVSLSELGKWAFSDCSHLAEVILPDGMREVGTGVFHYCTSLKNMDLGKGIKRLRRSAFSNCSSLVQVFAGYVTRVGKGAFGWCTSLESVTFGNGMTKLGEMAFHECTSLQIVKLGRGLIRLERYAFKDCSSLVEIVLPDEVKEVGARAFADCCSLKIVKLGSEVTLLEDGAFSNCSSLVEIIGEIKEVGKYVFYGCTSLKTLSIRKPADVTLDRQQWGLRCRLM
jgi:hypothetical protein